MPTQREEITNKKRCCARSEAHAIRRVVMKDTAQGGTVYSWVDMGPWP